MTKNKFLALLATCLVPTMLTSCAKEPDHSYSTEHDSKYAITYLMTNFEGDNHWNAEGVARESAPRGYHYIFDDPNSDLEYIQPHAQESEYCKDPETGVPYTPDYRSQYCSIMSGFECNSSITNAQFYPDSDLPVGDPDCPNVAFHMTGIAAGEGLGFGTYFSDYTYLTLVDDSNRYVRNDNDELWATFSDGRLNIAVEGDEYALTSTCQDDADFAGRIHHCYNDTDPSDDQACLESGNVCNTMSEEEDMDCCCVARVPFRDRFETDKEGLYRVYGSVYTRGSIYMMDPGDDTSNNYDYDNYYEMYKLDDQSVTPESSTTKIKEPRCLADMGQEGVVLWAKGNATIEVTLNLPETSPILDGGLCDEEGGEKCYDFHKVRFELDGAWREYHASWDEFVQEGWGKPVVMNPNQIINMQIKVVAPSIKGNTKDFDVWLDHVGFYGGTTWDFVNKLADTEWLILDTDTGTDTNIVDGTDSNTDDTDTNTDDTDTGTDTDTNTDGDTDTGTDTGTDTN
ncbi:MAG: hypothetical protein JXR45_20075 [Deltaproteobacteria bacterium]|nr:hypothetical protein [Deltaproteobacteria bacterium]